MLEHLQDTTALVRLRNAVGGLIVARSGDVPALLVEGLAVVRPGDAPSLRGVEVCNVTGEGGDYDLWLDGDLERADMTLAEVQAWLQVRK